VHAVVPSSKSSTNKEHDHALQAHCYRTCRLFDCFCSVSAQAQVSIDVSKITCDEYVRDKIPTPDFVSFSAVGSLEARAMLSRWLIAAWLSGYYHAKRNNWIIHLESFEDNVSKLTNYCYDEKNFKVPRLLKGYWASSSLMISKLSIIGAVGALLVIPTELSAQVGGAINPGVHVGGAVNPGATVRGAVERGIPGPDLGTWRSPSGEVHRSRKHNKAATKQRR
jgi:hypothetical protein